MLTSICLWWSEARLKPRSVKGEGEGVGTNEREGVVHISVGLPLPPGLTCPDLELLSMVELSRCFCIWSEMRDKVGTDMENESSSLLRESLLSVSRTKGSVRGVVHCQLELPGDSNEMEDRVSSDEAEEKPVDEFLHNWSIS